MFLSVVPRSSMPFMSTGTAATPPALTRSAICHMLLCFAFRVQGL